MAGAQRLVDGYPGADLKGHMIIFVPRWSPPVWVEWYFFERCFRFFPPTDPKEVLNTMRSYVRHFFGCRPCAEHFEEMAKESLSELSTLSMAVLWLWSRHNRVNNRLAGRSQPAVGGGSVQRSQEDGSTGGPTELMFRGVEN